MMDARKNARYLELLLNPLDLCTKYQPKFGTNDKTGVTLTQFQKMYGADPFYNWVGLDSDLMYAAHKAAGGMTSIYRQLGTGWDRLFRAIIQDELQISDENVAWSYDVTKKDGKKATLTLDGRIDLNHVAEHPAYDRVNQWIRDCGDSLEFPADRVDQLCGAVFEARQGYKSADAKRQAADLQFGLNAAAENYVPIVVIASTQASATVMRRYKNSKLLVLTGILSDDVTVSTYAFFEKIVGFDLAAFFKKNSRAMRERCLKVLHGLLAPK